MLCPSFPIRASQRVHAGKLLFYFIPNKFHEFDVIGSDFNLRTLSAFDCYSTDTQSLR